MASHIKRLVNRYGSMDPDDPALRRVYVRFARHLRVAVSATIDLKFLSLCLRAMLNIGRDGWLAAVDFVASSGVGHNELATLLRGLRPVEQLFLANQWLQQKQATDSSLRRMLLDIAATGGDHDPTTLLLFFSRLGQERVQVFYPLKELLLAAKFGKWLKEQVPLDHSANTELALARALYVLDDPGLTQSFLLARLDGSRNPGEYVWQLAIEKGGRGNDVLAKAVCRYLSKGELHVRQRAVDVLACLGLAKIRACVGSHVHQDTFHAQIFGFPVPGAGRTRLHFFHSIHRTGRTTPPVPLLVFTSVFIGSRFCIALPGRRACATFGPGRGPDAVQGLDAYCRGAGHALGWQRRARRPGCVGVDGNCSRVSCTWTLFFFGVFWGGTMGTPLPPSTETVRLGI